MSRNSVMVSSPPRCSRNSCSPRSSSQCPSASRDSSAACHRWKPSRLSSAWTRSSPPARQHADLHRVAGVERQADRHRLAVAQLVSCQRFQLVRRPVAVVERAGAAGLERIAALRDLAHVQFGAAPDHSRHGGGFAGAQRIGVRLQPFEEHSSRISATFTASAMPAILSRGCKRAQEVGIVEHRERRREAAEQVLDPERVDAVLHADAGIVLRQHRGRHADVAHAAMRATRRRSRSGRGTRRRRCRRRRRGDRRRGSTRRCCRRVEQRRIVLDLLAARHHLRRAPAAPWRRRAAPHSLRCRAPAIGKRAATLASTKTTKRWRSLGLAPQQGVAEHRVVMREQVLGEVHGVLVANRERLQVHRGTVARRVAAGS